MLDEKPCRSFDVRVNESNGDLLLVRGMDAYELRDVEAAIWRLCDGEHSVEAIATAITEEFDVEPDVARADTISFVEDLRAADLLE